LLLLLLLLPMTVLLTCSTETKGRCTIRATLTAYRLSDALWVLNDFWRNPRQCAAQRVHTYIMQ
jgi:VanZ family protein